jgi:hypothetical protein
VHTREWSGECPLACSSFSQTFYMNVYRGGDDNVNGPSGPLSAITGLRPILQRQQEFTWRSRQRSTALGLAVALALLAAHVMSVESALRPK